MYPNLIKEKDSEQPSVIIYKSLKYEIVVTWFDFKNSFRLFLSVE